MWSGRTPTTDRPAAVLLAAGASARMGSPKALVPVAGTTLVQHLLGCYGAAGCRPVVLVVGGVHEAAIRAAVGSQDGVLVVTNPDPSRGMLSSLQVGLAAALAGGPPSAVVFGPVDAPLADAQPVEMVLAGTGAVVAPTWAGVAGHPVALSPAAVRAVMAADPGTTPRTALVGFARVLIAVDDPGVVTNLNTAADLEAWRRSGDP